LEDDYLEDYLTDEEVIEAIISHIKELLEFSNSLENETIIKKLEDNGKAYNEQIGGYLWRGADIQVVECKKESNLKDWTKSIVSLGYSDDTPCPSRFPNLIAGLIMKLQEKADYLDAGNKYEFYGHIAERAQFIETRNNDFSKVELCRDVIFNQISLLNNWKRLILEGNANEQDNLLKKGWVVYFAFGKNVNWNDMMDPRRCPNAIPMGNARLHNYSFIIDNRGVGSIKKDKGKSVIGCLWIVSPEDIARLDLREGVARNIYRKETIKVESLMLFSNNNEVSSIVYISNSPEGVTAREDYIEGIIEGLSFSGFDEKEYSHYLNYIPNHSTKKQSIKQSKDKIQTPVKNFLPENIKLPFFAYGIFKKGQVSFFRIKDFVIDISQTHVDEAFLAERDGIPLLGIKKENDVLEGKFKEIYVDNKVYGDLMYFDKNKSKEAYKAIAEIEPQKQYFWGTLQIGKMKVNTLMGRRIFKGSIPMNEQSWDMAYHDPFIGGIIQFKEDVFASEDRSENFIELQALYLMIWTAIERLCALKYSLTKKSEGLEYKLIDNLKSNRKVYEYITKISNIPSSFRPIYRSDDTGDKYVFEKSNFIKSLKYLRQIRNNVAHRGKGGFADEILTRDAIEIVYEIFKILKSD